MHAAPTQIMCTLMVDMCTLMIDVCTLMIDVCTLMIDVCTLMIDVCTLMIDVCTLMIDVFACNFGTCLALYSILIVEFGDIKLILWTMFVQSFRLSVACQQAVDLE